VNKNGGILYMPCYALFLKVEDDEIDYYPKLENHSMSFEEIEAYLTKNGVEKWSLYDHVPNEEDIEVFSGVCFDSSDGECD
jgi:L-rhamnose mutarotase